MALKQFAPAAERNGFPILEVLKHELGDAESVLEIGSGTGQHAVLFAAVLRHLVWQTSDLNLNHAGILACLHEADLPNIVEPIALDVRTAVMADSSYDAVYSANTAHIMAIDAVSKMFSLVARLLRPGGVFCLYGPFREQGRFNAPSNAAFDETLRRQDSSMGLRDLEALDDWASEGGLFRLRRYAMPANNLLIVWQQR